MSLSFLRQRPRAVGSLLGLATWGAASASNAQQAQWHDGGFQYVEGLACVVWIPETTVTAFAGYWATDDASFPATGDVTYIRAAAAVVGNPCAGGDTIGFEFFAPSQTELAVSANTPVRCLATNLETGETTSVDPNIHCLQTPEQGDNGGAFFGYATVASGWMFEIRVPVRFLRRMTGGSAPTDQLQVLTSTSGGDVVTTVSPLVAYRANVGYTTPSATWFQDNTYQLHSYVYSYNQGGTLSVDLTTQSGVYDDINDYGPYQVPDGQIWNGITTTIPFNTGFSSSIYWRAKYVTPIGTYYGSEQVFQTNGSTPVAYTLSVQKAGAGTGNVHSASFDIDCGETCSLEYTAGSPVTLTAAADPGSTFLGWSGACSGTDDCTLMMNSDLDATAEFGVASGVTYGSLDLAVEGLPAGPNGTMYVTGPSFEAREVTLPSGIGQNLSDVLPGAYTAEIEQVTWGEEVYVPRPVNISTVVVGGGNGSLTAHYELARALSLTFSGNGAGSVQSNPAGIDCTTNCAAHFADGETVELTATAASGSSFVGWTGACSGQGVCLVDADAALAVGAEFVTEPGEDTDSSSDVDSTTAPSSSDAPIDTDGTSGASTHVVTDAPTDATSDATEAPTDVTDGPTADAGAPPLETSAEPASTAPHGESSVPTDVTRPGETSDGDETETPAPTLDAAAADAGVTGTPAPSGDPGCNCRVAGQPQAPASTHFGYLGALLGASMWFRRRTARRSKAA